MSSAELAKRVVKINRSKLWGDIFIISVFRFFFIIDDCSLEVTLGILLYMNDNSRFISVNTDRFIRCILIIFHQTICGSVGCASD